MQRAAGVARQNTARRARETARVEPAAAVTGSACVAPESERVAFERRQAERDAAVRAEKLAKQSGVPARYRGASLADALARVPAEVREKYGEAAARLARLLERPGIVAMIGPRGPGKTWLGCALVLEFCRRGRAAVRLAAMDYFVELKQTYDARARRDESQVETDYVRPDLVVIDELHERGDTAWEDRMLTRIVNKRYEEGRATVLISNQMLAEFTTRVGPSIAERMNDDEGGVIVCDWPSLRGRVNSGGPGV